MSDEESSVGAEVNGAIHSALGHRSTRRGTFARSVENVVKRGGARAWVELKRHPFLGIAAAGVGGVALASAVGVAELALGIAVAYGAFNVLVRGESPEKAAALLAQEVERV